MPSDNDDIIKIDEAYGTNFADLQKKREKNCCSVAKLNTLGCLLFISYQVISILVFVSSDIRI